MTIFNMSTSSQSDQKLSFNPPKKFMILKKLEQHHKHVFSPTNFLIQIQFELQRVPMGYSNPKNTRGRAR
ncbi:hypothetical protein C1H46_045422 [Malus baccata]|uniref:Uncharacterized protein n=1 Tax=Malus baccata TaxID=106549 RepID=A0A540K495_MALBA|nr:hypothetical protein C1H46_045422 [Malus baccata]